MFLNNRCAFELELVLLVEGIKKIDILTKLTNILIKLLENINKKISIFRTNIHALIKSTRKKFKKISLVPYSTLDKLFNHTTHNSLR